MREIPDHPMELGYLQPGWHDSGLAKTRRPPVEDVCVFAIPGDAARHRSLYQGEGRHTVLERKTVKLNGISVTLHVLVIRRVQHD